MKYKIIKTIVLKTGEVLTVGTVLESGEDGSLYTQEGMYVCGLGSMLQLMCMKRIDE